MARFRFKYNNQEVEVEAKRQGDTLQISFQGKEVEIRLAHKDRESVLLERERPGGMVQQIRVAGAADGDRRQLWVDGKYITYHCLQRGRGASPEDLSHSLSASIPAVVSQIMVSEGDLVQIGDKLILLESMKMIIPIQSPCAGTITAINCGVGDAVQPGVQLIEIDEE